MSFRQSEATRNLPLLQLLPVHDRWKTDDFRRFLNHKLLWNDISECFGRLLVTSTLMRFTCSTSKSRMDDAPVRKSGPGLCHGCMISGRNKTLGNVFGPGVEAIVGMTAGVEVGVTGMICISPDQKISPFVLLLDPTRK